MTRAVPLTVEFRPIDDTSARVGVAMIPVDPDRT
jgi:hypothetical protein